MALSISARLWRNQQKRLSGDEASRRDRACPQANAIRTAGMRWYKHDPAAALEGFIGLSAEERGFYITLIDLCYARAPHGFVTDELVVKAMACDPRVWRRVKAALVAKGK